MWLPCLSRAHLGLHLAEELQWWSMWSAATIVKREDSQPSSPTTDVECRAEGNECSGKASRSVPLLKGPLRARKEERQSGPFGASMLGHGNAQASSVKRIEVRIHAQR